MCRAVRCTEQTQHFSRHGSEVMALSGVDTRQPGRMACVGPNGPARLRTGAGLPAAFALVGLH